MRYLYFLFLILGSNAWANNGYSQIMSQRLKVGGGTLETVFRQIMKECNCEFFYDTKVLDVKRAVNFTERTATVKEILDQVLGDRYSFSERDHYILITEKERQQADQMKAVVVKGKITAVDGSPLPGVTVMIPSVKFGVVSDTDGTYTISIPSVAEPVLSFSFVGMKSKLLRYPGSGELNVVLEEDVALLDEAIVTGYQEISRSKMTGAVEVITADKIANKGYNFVSEILKGQLAGVSVRSTSGRPGSDVEIRIRGINSINGNKEPMWILDGKPMSGSISELNPDDIESITALKDAAATAIYGSQAANGVMVVKTKRGKEGKGRLSINSNFSFDGAPDRVIPMMNTQEKIAFERSIYADFPNANLGGRVMRLLSNAALGKIPEAEAEAGIAALENTQTDWYKELLRLAYSHAHSVALSGGSQGTQYYVSFNYRALQGIEPYNKYNSGGLSSNLSHKFNSWLDLGIDFRTSYRDNRQSASRVNIVEYAAMANPYERLYNEDGSYAYDRSYLPDLSSIRDDYKFNFNVMEDYKNNSSNTISAGVEGTLNLRARIYKGLRFSTLASFSHNTSHLRKVLNPGSYTSMVSLWIASAYNGELPPSFNKGQLSEHTTRRQNWNVRNQLEYAQTFGSKHSISLFLSQDVSMQRNYSFGMMMPEYNPQLGLAGFPDLSGISGAKLRVSSLNQTSENETRSVSFFGTASYSYDERFVVSSSFRLDGVSVIDPKNCYTPLWNISGRWNVHKERFMENTVFVDQLSLRLSYGYTGNIDRNALPYTMLSFRTGGISYNGVDLPTQMNPANPSVKWERKQDRSFGIESKLFNGRIGFTVNYYNNVVRDLLDQRKLPISSGQHFITANVSSVRNTGWEITLNADLLRFKDFLWSVSMNTSFNQNKILSTYFKSISDIRASFGGSSVEGYPANAWFGYRFAGVDPLTGQTMAYTEKTDEQGRHYGHLMPDGRYAINMETEKKDLATAYLGAGYPPLSGGFSTSIRYKRIHLSANFSVMARHMITSNSTIETGGTLSKSAMNVPKTAANRWRKPGDITDVPVYTSSTSSWQNDVYDFKLMKGSYVKCNNITVGYSFPGKVCKYLNVSNIRLNMNLQEVFTLSTYKIGDPENFSAYGYPNARKYMFSLNIGI